MEQRTHESGAAAGEAGFDVAATLAACAGGDRTALHRLYEAEADRMLGVARRILKRDALAEEAVHDSFVLIFRQAARFDPARGSGRTWIYAILRNRALNILRGEKRTDFVDDYEPFGLEAEDESPEAALVRLSESGRLRACLERLEAPRRTAILLAYVNGLTHGELAGRFGVPLGTMKSWIRRSLLSLRECLA
ncbi:sigma-70 family RNA polymerase sigma factor [Aquabacter spiritensis]|uniref:RNA polymerase sigma-70 factor (ECF subfamily) n=1 Tax=Aquabacter spiritensis TaxID=933073 RepID=A0A4R3M4B6_9HYPH|nr:sigma-70 family RNA polymerase sigma factor [Aquabacter spiritensis]TCT08131.1 RNA polymerase sigma-70 factor (ECF subfamily) [Aquabacter spiritensis]